MGKRSIIVAAFAVAVVLATPLLAVAAESTSTSNSKTETRTYDLDFTLPTAGKSGCTVCHGDPNLVKSGDTTSSIFVNEETLAGSAHKETVCTGCHIDFAYKTPHQNVQNGSDWQTTAKNACKNCHEPEFTEVNTGAHSPAGKPGQTPEQLAAEREAQGKPPEVPVCGDCHGSHEIPYLAVERHQEEGDATKTAAAQEGQAQIHSSGAEMCGGCHVEQSDTYADYYHGAAYRRGAPDAPACWDCHGAHQMLPADNRQSPVHPSQLTETCGRCHDDVDENYVEYAQLVHRKDDVKAEFPIYDWWASARTAVEGAFQAIASWF